MKRRTMMVSVSRLSLFFALVVCPHPGQAQTQQQVLRILSATLSPSDIASLPPAALSQAESQGWTQTAPGMELIKPWATTQVTNGVATLTTDSNGYFTPLAGQNGPWSVVVSGISYPLTQNGNVWSMTTDYTTLDGNGTDAPGQGTGGGSGKTGGHNPAPGPQAATKLPHCNDQNGPWSNGNTGATGKQKYQNFLGSDCYNYLAIYSLNCLLDNKFGLGGCAARNGGQTCTQYLPPSLRGPNLYATGTSGTGLNSTLLPRELYALNETAPTQTAPYSAFPVPVGYPLALPAVVNYNGLVNTVLLASCADRTKSSTQTSGCSCCGGSMKSTSSNSMAACCKKRAPARTAHSQTAGQVQHHG